MDTESRRFANRIESRAESAPDASLPAITARQDEQGYLLRDTTRQLRTLDRQIAANGDRLDAQLDQVENRLWGRLDTMESRLDAKLNFLVAQVDLVVELIEQAEPAPSGPP